MDVPPASRIWNEEIFGPVLCVREFKTEEEAVELANGTVYGLAGRGSNCDLYTVLSGTCTCDCDGHTLSMSAISKVPLLLPL